MASSDTVLEIVESSKVAPVKLCTFCNNAKNGCDKWLYVIEQDRSPFFPILGTIRGAKTIYDESGKALVCIACFHHLLRQWSSFDRRRVPLQKREYSLVTGMQFSRKIRAFENSHEQKWPFSSVVCFYLGCQCIDFFEN